MNESTGRRGIDSLIQGYLEKSLTEDESRRLLASLRRDSSLVTTILENLRTDCLIRAVVSDIAAVEGVDQDQKILPIPHPAENTLVPARPGRRRRHWPEVLALAACLALLVGLSIWYFGPTIGDPVLTGVQGVDVSIERGTEFVPASNGMRIQSGDVVRVGTNDTAAIAFGRENTRIDVRAGTELKLASLKKGKKFNLLSGTIQASVARQRPLWPMIVTTPNAEARVLGTRFTLTATTNRTRLDVAEGRVRFTRTSDGAAVKVGARHYAVVATGTELAALPQTGALLREIWTGIPGGDIRDLLEHPDYPAKPLHRDLLKTFETPAIETNNFGCRLVGYLHPPVTGDYTFWVVSGSDATFWLSPDDDPSRNVVVASAPGGLLRKWNAPLGLGSGDVARPQSPKIPLVAGRCYFFQVLQKTVSGSSHLAVAWQPPDGQREVISGEFLSPFKPNPKEKQP
jgi:FecR protein/PA14 domain